MKKTKRKEIICRCNNISRETIERAIVNGCATMNEIFDDTTAGVGPCGGSCRRKLLPLLQSYLKEKTFPEVITPIEWPTPDAEPTEGQKDESE